MGLAVLSLMAVGSSACLDFLHTLTSYAHRTGAGSPGFKVFKQVDINSFFTMLFAGPTVFARVTIVVTALLAAVILLRAWRYRQDQGGDSRVLAMGATLTWNAVFNLYTPIYDLTLLIPGLLMTADVLYRRPRTHGHPPGKMFVMFAVLLVLGEGVSQTLARDYGFQLLPPIVLALGAYQVALIQDETQPIPLEGR